MGLDILVSLLSRVDSSSWLFMCRMGLELRIAGGADITERHELKIGLGSTDSVTGIIELFGVVSWHMSVWTRYMMVRGRRRALNLSDKPTYFCKVACALLPVGHCLRITSGLSLKPLISVVHHYFRARARACVLWEVILWLQN